MFSVKLLRQDYCNDWYGIKSTYFGNTYIYGGHLQLWLIIAVRKRFEVAFNIFLGRIQL